MSVTQERGFDVYLLAATLALLFLGLVMVYSSSSFMAEQRFDSQYYFLKRQAGAILAGIALMLVIARLNYLRLEAIAMPFLLLSFVLLIAVLIPGVGMKIGGARRWLQGPGFNFQPAEIAKLAIVIYAAALLGRQGDRLRESMKGTLPLIVLAGLAGVLMLVQPDFGSAAMVMALLVVMLFVAGMKLRYLGYGLLAVLPLLVALVASSDYRRTRILAFIDPWESRTGTGYQIVQSFLAFGAGGWHGVGLGDGQQKLLYLPEAHTDFIFSVVGEELGLIGVVFTVGLYAVVIWRGTRMAVNASHPFGAYLAAGLTSLVALQAIMNMGVVMGLLPTKGLTLPLMSYGGSSVVIILLAIGTRSPAQRH